MLKRMLITCPLLLALQLSMNAQYLPGKHEVGITIGAAVYQGDLSPSALGSYKTMRPVIGILYNHLIDPYLSVRGQLNFGSLYGNDSLYAKPDYMRSRNFNFRSKVTELDAMLVFHPYGNNGNSTYIKLDPYVMAGLGIARLRTTRDWSRTDLNYFSADTKLFNGLAVDTMHALPKTLAVIPIGIGLRYPITDKLSLVGEAVYRYTFTDYLDGFSQAANPKLKDSYYNVSIGAVFNFGRSQLDCPRY